MVRVRFAPSPTGFLHIGSARTFIFNWLYARHNNGTMVLRIDDTDVDRNTQASRDSIFDGLKWLDLGWDDLYHQSERIELHRHVAWRILEQGLAHRDFSPALADSDTKERSDGPWLFNPAMRELSAEESQHRADAGEPFVLRFRVPRDSSQPVEFRDAVYGPQSKLPLRWTVRIPRSARTALGYSIPPCESYLRRKARTAPTPANHLYCAFECLVTARSQSNSATPSMARNPSYPPISKTSPCSAATAFPPITWRPAPTTST